MPAPITESAMPPMSGALVSDPLAASHCMVPPPTLETQRQHITFPQQGGGEGSLAVDGGLRATSDNAPAVKPTAAARRAAGGRVPRASAASSNSGRQGAAAANGKAKGKATSNSTNKDSSARKKGAATGQKRKAKGAAPPFVTADGFDMRAYAKVRRVIFGHGVASEGSRRWHTLGPSKVPTASFGEAAGPLTFGRDLGQWMRNFPLCFGPRTPVGPGEGRVWGDASCRDRRLKRQPQSAVPATGGGSGNCPAKQQPSSLPTAQPLVDGSEGAPPCTSNTLCVDMVPFEHFADYLDGKRGGGVMAAAEGADGEGSDHASGAASSLEVMNSVAAPPFGLGRVTVNAIVGAFNRYLAESQPIPLLAGTAEGNGGGVTSAIPLTGASSGAAPHTMPHGGASSCSAVMVAELSCVFLHGLHRYYSLVRHRAWRAAVLRQQLRAKSRHREAVVAPCADGAPSSEGPPPPPTTTSPSSTSFSPSPSVLYAHHPLVKYLAYPITQACALHEWEERAAAAVARVPADGHSAAADCGEEEAFPLLPSLADASAMLGAVLGPDALGLFLSFALYCPSPDATVTDEHLAMCFRVPSHRAPSSIAASSRPLSSDVGSACAVEGSSGGPTLPSWAHAIGVPPPDHSSHSRTDESAHACAGDAHGEDLFGMRAVQLMRCYCEGLAQFIACAVPPPLAGDGSDGGAAAGDGGANATTPPISATATAAAEPTHHADSVGVASPMPLFPMTGFWPILPLAMAVAVDQTRLHDARTRWIGAVLVPYSLAVRARALAEAAHIAEQSDEGWQAQRREAEAAAEAQRAHAARLAAVHAQRVAHAQCLDTHRASVSVGAYWDALMGGKGVGVGPADGGTAVDGIDASSLVSSPLPFVGLGGGPFCFQLATTASSASASASSRRVTPLKAPLASLRSAASPQRAGKQAPVGAVPKGGKTAASKTKAPPAKKKAPPLPKKGGGGNAAAAKKKPAPATSNGRRAATARRGGSSSSPSDSDDDSQHSVSSSSASSSGGGDNDTQTSDSSLIASIVSKRRGSASGGARRATASTSRKPSNVKAKAPPPKSKKKKAAKRRSFDADFSLLG